MKFGISSWFYQDRSIIESLNRISECGFGAVEIWMHHLWKTKERPQDIAHAAGFMDPVVSLSKLISVNWSMFI